MHEQKTSVKKDAEENTIVSKLKSLPEWAKLLGGLGSVAGLIKVIIELTK